MARKIALEIALMTADDAAAFAEAMRGAKTLSGPARVTPLADERDTGQPQGKRGAARSGTSTRSAARAPSAATDASVAEPMFSPEPSHASSNASSDTSSNGAWNLRAEGVDARTMKRLRRGELPVEARVDLHGLTRVKAARTVEQFLAAARASGLRGVLIIHGRGLHSGDAGPALRDLVRSTLRDGTHAAAILAATPAPAALGGAGATLVWLRRA